MSIRHGAKNRQPNALSVFFRGEESFEVLFRIHSTWTGVAHFHEIAVWAAPFRKNKEFFTTRREQLLQSR